MTLVHTLTCMEARIDVGNGGVKLRMLIHQQSEDNNDTSRTNPVETSRY